ncbi:zinc finger protein 770 [Mantella aurantiaca]
MLKCQLGRAVRKAPRRRPYACDVCAKHFETPSKLERHYLTHTGQKPFQCLDCNKTFRQLVHLERHMMTHALPFQCPVCLRHFKNADTFAKHQRLHLEGARLKARAPKKPAAPRPRRCPPWHCPGCRRTFESEEKRLLHPCDFADGIPEAQRCCLCDKAFPSRSKLERHVMIHTGQRPFACVLCGKAFRQKAHLKIHEATHSQERPFQCPHCFQAFRKAEQLLKHEKGHAAVNTIEIGVGISAAGTMRVKEEPDEIFPVCVLPFQCSSCDQYLDSQESLDAHVCEEMNACGIRNASVTCEIRNAAGVRGGMNASDICEELDARGGMNVADMGEELDAHRGMNVADKHGGMNATDMCEEMDVSDVHGVMNASDMHGVMSVSDMHGVMPAHVAVTCPIKRRERAPVKTPKRRGLYLDPHSVLFPAEPSERTLKFEHLEESERTDSNALPHQPFAAPRNILQLRPQQKAKPSRKPFGPSHLLLGRHPRNPHLGNRMAGERDAGSCHAGGQRDPAGLRDAFHHFLQQAQNVLRARHRIRRCDRCDKAFPSMSKLRRHYLTHTGQKPFPCAECGRSFRQSAHLKRHRVTHLEKDPLYGSHTSGGYHSPFHRWQENSTYQLDSCRSAEDSRDFSEVALVAPEIKVEAVELPEAAKRPGVTKRARVTLPRVRNAKPGQDRSLLTMRSRVLHKRYRCAVCAKSFLSPSKLERHHLTHSGQRPYVCQECGKCFRQDPHLKRHMVTHVKMVA